MTRFVSGQEIYQKAGNGRFSKEERRFFGWLHYREAFCCLSRRPSFEIAHTGGYTEGKGMARKATFKTCLPLFITLHHLEEAARDRFWPAVGVPNYLEKAESLYRCFEDDISPYPVLMDIFEQSNHDVVAAMLKGEWKP